VRAETISSFEQRFERGQTVIEQARLGGGARVYPVGLH